MNTMITFETLAEVKELPYTYTYTNKCNVVLIGGKAKVGKTTTSNYLYSTLKFYEVRRLRLYQTAFAYPIKELATNHFNWDGKKDEKGRRLLQVIGYEAGRAYDENLWIKKLEDRVFNQIFPYNFVFVDDWRFPNERDYFKKNPFYEVTAIGITRDVKLDAGYDHPSENSLDMSEMDFVIDNNGTIEELNNKLDSIYRYLTSKIIIY